MAFYRQALNDTLGAVPLLRESVAMLSALRPPADRNVVLAQGNGSVYDRCDCRR
jgi:hypothetical protein